MKIMFIAPEELLAEEGLALDMFCKAAEHCGAQAGRAEAGKEDFAADVLVYCCASLDHRVAHARCEARGMRFAAMGPYEDFINYHSLAMGLYEYASCYLGHSFCSDNGMEYQIELLYELPHLIDYFGEAPPLDPIHNTYFLQNATVCIATSEEEKKSMRRDAVGAKVEKVPFPHIPFLPLGHAEFLELSGLGQGEYILHLGGLHPRSNSLGAILASRHIDVPLVLFDVDLRSDAQALVSLEMASRERLAPTIFISDSLPTGDEGSVHVISIDKKKWKNLAFSALQDCGLYLQSSFSQPWNVFASVGAHMGVPVVASSLSYTELYSDMRTQYPGFSSVLPHDFHEMEKKVVAMLGKRYSGSHVHQPHDLATVGTQLLTHISHTIGSDDEPCVKTNVANRILSKVQ